MFQLNSLIIIFTFLSPLYVLAHGDEKHENKQLRNQEELISKELQERLDYINSIYKEKVKPIFKAKCLDCHGSPKNYPFYYQIPGIKQLMNRDIREAKKHMDMSKDFPFLGHGSPKEDLESLQKTIKEETMPPWQYKLINWNTSLNKEEKQIINSWINKSLELIKESENKITQCNNGGDGQNRTDKIRFCKPSL